MTKLLTLFLSALLFTSATARTEPQIPKGHDIFITISKYISNGDTEALSAWFSDYIDMSIMTKGGSSSRRQAKLILKSFFENYTPRSFEIVHTSGNGGMKYALGNLNAGGEKFLVTVFVSTKGDTCQIQELKIERQQ